ncbi:MAG: hypothetical protein K1W18_07250 [Oscillospiraceae bacterium]
MVTFKIVIRKPYYKEITRHLKEDESVINETIYSILTRYGIDDETAIDCACWCELATIGESYNEENFDIYVEE